MKLGKYLAIISRFYEGEGSGGGGGRGRTIIGRLLSANERVDGEMRQEGGCTDVDEEEEEEGEGEGEKEDDNGTCPRLCQPGIAGVPATSWRSCSSCPRKLDLYLRVHYILRQRS